MLLTMLHLVRPKMSQKLLKIAFVENYLKKLAQVKDSLENSVKQDYVTIINHKKKLNTTH